MQALGSALTYGQRYNVRLLLNLTSEDDDDGQQATGERERPRHDVRPRQPANEVRKQHETGEYAGLSVGTKPARGDATAQEREGKARAFAQQSIAAFGTMDSEALSLWWRD